MRILVIEDDPRIAVSISDSLQDLGHRTVEADTVADALDVIRGGAIDLVISDLGLADNVRAETFLEAIRTLHPTLPIIVATGLEPSQELVHGRPHGPPDEALRHGGPGRGHRAPDRRGRALTPAA